MPSEIIVFVLIGFCAQLIDGALGMAFGVIATSSLLAFGAPPAMASAAVHTAEIGTTGVSGLSHLWQRNVAAKLFWQLVLPGVIGGALGAYVLVDVIPEWLIRPVVTIYLMAMAILIFVRLLGGLRARSVVRRAPLGFAGGFLDAIGGGGWGPIVASTLIAGGDKPRRTIGSVNLAEFFVTTTISATFMLTLDIASYAHIVLGLVIGGVIAAPLAGWLVRVLPARLAMAMVATVLAGLSAYNLSRLFT